MWVMVIDKWQIVLKNLQKKLTKLSTKAQECTSRKKAQKILKKYEKTKTAIYKSSRSDDSLL